MAPFSMPSFLKICHYHCSFTKLQSVPPTIWYRLVAGLNARLRLVRRGHLRDAFSQIVDWLETHANPSLRAYGIRVDLTRIQPSASDYYQFGLVVCAVENEPVQPSNESPSKSLSIEKKSRYVYASDL